MSLSEIVGAFVERRRPPRHLRDQVDLAFRIQGQSVEIFEVRPDWMDGAQKIEERVAKATYQKSKRVWKVYWQRADLEWHVYEPMPEVTALEQFVANRRRSRVWLLLRVSTVRSLHQSG